VPKRFHIKLGAGMKVQRSI